MSIYDQIKQKLDDAHMPYTTHHHEPTRTSQDASRIRGVPLHEGAKALVVRVDGTNEYVLCVIPAHLRLDAKKVRAVLGSRISFAQDPEAVTGCVPGSVPPYGSVIGLKTYCDERLSQNDIMHFNAGSLTDSITMRCADYIATEQPKITDIAEHAK